MTETTSLITLSLSLILVAAMAMAELKALCAIHPKTFTDSDVAAAQQLVQLSGEDNSSSSNKKGRKNENESGFEDDQESDRSSQNEITSRMIEEIFGIEEEVARPRKKRYRSLVSIYQAMDMPLRNNVRYGKKVSTEENPKRVSASAEEGNQSSKT